MISVYAQNPYLFRHGPIRTAGGDSPAGLGNPPGRPPTLGDIPSPQ